MSEEITPTPTPVTEAPATAPVVAAETVPAAVETTPAPVVETPVEPSQSPVEATPTEQKPETLLGEALKKEEPAPVETKTESKPETTTPETKVEPTAETKPDGQSAEPAPPPTYDSFTLPENVQLDNEKVKQFTDILGELETTSKADHAVVQQFGQKAVDLFVQEVQNTVAEVQKVYQDAWEKQKTAWKDAFLSDPEIGGNRFQTTVNSARDFIRTHGGTPEQQAEFRAVMETSGLGNHPAIIRLLANANQAMSEGRPLATVKPVPQPKSRLDTMYRGK